MRAGGVRIGPSVRTRVEGAVGVDALGADAVAGATGRADAARGSDAARTWCVPGSPSGAEAGPNAAARARALHSLGLRALRRGDALGALEPLYASLAMEPSAPHAWNDAGVAHQRSGAPEAAAACYLNAVRLLPDSLDALVNLSFALHQCGRYDEALSHAQAAVDLAPFCAESHWHRALALLSLGSWREGFAAYEWRLAHPRFASLYPLVRERPEALWDGIGRPGRTLLVTSEQGLGDAIQFSRYLGLVADSGMRVVFECQPDLARLVAGMDLGRSGGEVRVVPRGEDVGAWDFHCPLLSLAPRVGFDALGSGAGFFRPIAPARPLDWGRGQAFLRTAGRGPRPLRLGVCWKGNAAHSDDVHRSAEARDFAVLGTVPGVEIVNLQRAATTPELCAFPRGIKTHESALPDLAARAALIATLDLVVTVDTAVAHLAGTLGVPCWILLSKACDWRWGGDAESTPWYPSARLFRQSDHGDWTSVLSRIVAELAELAELAVPEAERQSDRTNAAHASTAPAGGRYTRLP